MEGEDQGQRDDKSGKPKSADSAEGTGKGKEKEKEASMFDRLQASGRMASEALTSNQGLSTSSPSSTKTLPMISDSRIGGAGETLHDASTSRPRNRAPQETDSFRRVSESGETSHAFSEFVEGRGSALPTEPIPGQPLPEGAVAACAEADGSAVVDLLAQPHIPDLMPNPEIDQGDTLAPETAERLRKALFSSTGSGLPWDNLLNFTPGFVATLDADVTESRLYMGTTDTSAAKEAWLHQWHDVLSAYTDEVWGDLGPLVSSAKLEIEEHASLEPPSRDEPEAGALGRLRMILAHVRGSTNEDA